MTEILTESFCERCGTRYTFESSAPRRSRVGRMRTFSKGVRNFVLSDEASFSEAMADARSEDEIAATAHQLDAFHQTFNFCLTCRQYTCGNCWNQTDGRCLTCSPIPGTEAPDEPAVAGAAELPVADLDGNGHAPELEGVWPEADLARIQAVLGAPATIDEELDLAAQHPATPERPATIEDSQAQPAQPETVGIEAAPGGDAEAAAERAMPSIPAADVSPLDAAAFSDVAAHSEPAAMPMGVAPGQSLEDAIAAYESQLDAGEATVPAAGEAAEPASQPQMPAEPPAPPAERGIAASGAPAAYDSAPLGTPATGVEAGAASDLALPPPPPPTAAPALPAAAASDDVIVQPTWPVPARPETAPAAQPPAAPPPAAPPADQPPAAQPPAAQPPAEPAATPWLRVAPDDAGARSSPEWPAAAAWPSAADRDYPTTLAGRPLMPRDDVSSLWAASAREVLGAAPNQPAAPAATATPQPCVQCGLSLSANARFCRRCGARQG